MQRLPPLSVVFQQRAEFHQASMLEMDLAAVMASRETASV